METEIDLLMNGDLCVQYFKGPGECYKSIPQRGILGINSNIISGIRIIKDYYDGTNKTSAEKNITLNLDVFRDIEYLYFYNALGFIYNKIESLLMENIFGSIEDFKDRTTTIIISFSVVFIACLGIIWYPIWRALKNERRVLGGILVIIPYSILLKNRGLKRYFMILS